ncbi:MAG TPA: SGNH/GDSL hydrolase family protein, partial [Acidobacteriota bacterium]
MFHKPVDSPKLSHYIALGDSMSIDDYPGEGKGAASLLYKNLDEVYPDFRGKDLQTAYPRIRFKNLAIDGATTFDILHHQLDKIRVPSSDSVLFTLTAGGNDILTGEDADDIIFRLDAIVHALLNNFPLAQLILGTVYDPTDGTKILFEDRPPVEQEYKTFEIVNDAIRAFAKHPRTKIVDVFAHFLGHGNFYKDPQNP